jgi:CelD/BcsL family acetyltransferase involved in cellulose biosynthesis
MSGNGPGVARCWGRGERKEMSGNNRTSRFDADPGRARSVDIRFSVEPAIDPQAIEPVWRDLESRSDGSFFLSWHWIGTWLKESACRPDLIIGRLGTSVVALAFLVNRRLCRRRWLRSDSILLHETGDRRTDSVFIEYNGILVDRRFGRAAAGRCLEFLVKTKSVGAGAPPWEELFLGGVPEDCHSLVQSSGLGLRVISARPTAAIDLATMRRNGWNSLDSISRNTRYQIRRSMRLYERRGILRLDEATDVSEAFRFFDHLKDLHQKHWLKRNKPGAFSNPFFERFHRSLIARALPAGNAEILRITAGGEPIGYLYNFLFRDWVGTYLSGFAYEDDPRLKPGLVSYHLCAERHLARGMRSLDFLAGDDRYKTSLGQPGKTMLWMSLQRPRWKFWIENRIRDLRPLLAPAEAKRRQDP